jgi:glycerol-3-phosphate dehydrogenase
MERKLETQVLVIGAGITGTAIARELSKYRLNVILVEKGLDVAGGQTKCNAGMVYSPVGLTWAGSLVIKSIVDEPGTGLLHPESLKERLTLKGFNVFPNLARELDIQSFTPSTYLMVATNEAEVKLLQETEELCKQIGFEPEKLSREAVIATEPNITGKVVSGLLDRSSEFVIYPWEYCIALMENARENGVTVITGAEVTAIEPLDGGFSVETTRGRIRTEYIVNAAGIRADEVAKMAGVCDFGFTLMKGQTEILDKRLKGLLKNSIGPPPEPGGGGKITPFPSGNIGLGFIGYTPINDKEDLAGKKEWSEKTLARTRELVNGIQSGDIITSYTGIRVFNTRNPEDHIIEATEKYPNFINAVIRLPGLAASAAIAEYVVDLLGNQGLSLVSKTEYNPYRKSIPKVSELPEEKRSELIARDSRYGHIVCRCEEVSEGEIVEAIRRGARTVAAVKYRTRAGMGRCQGGFCGPRVVEILARELDIPMKEVTLKGGLSRVLLYRSKELLA